MSRLLSPGLQKYRVKFFDVRRVAAGMLEMGCYGSRMCKYDQRKKGGALF